MLKYMQGKANHKDNFIISTTTNLPNDINRDSALHQLEEEGFCYDVKKNGTQWFFLSF